jgi:hypothetical protein
MLLAAAAIGLTASTAGFAADPNQAERYGRDSVTVWNSHVPLSPPSAMPRGVQPALGYGRAGGPPPSYPVRRPANEPVQATNAERHGRA